MEPGESSDGDKNALRADVVRKRGATGADDDCLERSEEGGETFCEADWLQVLASPYLRTV